MRALVDRVVRSLRVRGSRVAIERSQKRIAAEKRQREIHQQQQYMQAASTMMAQALRTTTAPARASSSHARRPSARTIWSRAACSRSKRVRCRAREETHEQLLDYLGPHFYEEVEEKRRQQQMQQQQMQRLRASRPPCSTAAPAASTRVA